MSKRVYNKIKWAYVNNVPTRILKRRVIMARPRKWRKVCCLPDSNMFGPLDAENTDSKPIIMTVDEYETIRLIDLEGMMQEECADRMDVARTTVQRIYNDARKKIAEALVNGNVLRIEGGDYMLYDENEKIYGCRRCRKHRCSERLEHKNNIKEEEISK